MSVSDGPPAKRQRKEKVPIIRSNTIWHSDGSVVLQAQGTQFRVHWSLLAMHSSFFRDMQALPQPPDQPSIEGCPVVELHDAQADVENLLTVLYTPMFPSEPTTTFPTLAACIRLGRKYDFRKLLDWAVELVMEANPTLLRRYDAVGFTGDEVEDFEGLELEILTLARENSILSALPCAYYRVVTTRTQIELFDGVVNDDEDDVRVISLGPIDLRRCILGREALLAAQMQQGYTLGWLSSWRPRSRDCSDTTECTRSRDAEVRRHLKNADVIALDYTLPNGVFCSGCTRQINALVDAGKVKVWQELPKFFELPAWNDLKNDL